MSKLFKRMLTAALTASLCISGSAIPYANAVDTEPSASQLLNADETLLNGAVEESGTHGLYQYQYYNKDQGSISVEFQNRRGYDFSWNDADDCMCMTGEVFDRIEWDENMNKVTVRTPLYGKPMIEYRAISEGDGNYLFGAYGWLGDNDAEFFIIDDWGAEKPDYSVTGEALGEVESDGAVYNIYKVQHPFTKDSDTYTYCYYIVRNEKKSADGNMITGTINVANHFKALNDLGVDTSSPFDIMLATEGYGSSGAMHVTKNDLYYLPEIEEDHPDVEYIPDEEDINNYTGTVFNGLVNNERDGYYFNTFYDTVLADPEDANEIRLELIENGGFKCDWKEVYEAEFEKGLKYYQAEDQTIFPLREYNGEELTVEYSADLKEGKAFAGGHGWLNGGSVEYMIVDAYRGWDPQENDNEFTKTELLGTETIDGAEYDIYYSDHFFYKLYLSVRKENKLTEDNTEIEGVININDHLDAFKKHGLAVADPEIATFQVTGVKGSGSAVVTKDIVKIDGEDIYIPSPAAEEILEKVFHYIPGDLNDDKKVNSFDMVIARAELLKSFNGEECLEAADIDCSGETHINDVVLLNKLVLGEDIKVPTVRPEHKTK